MTAATRWVAILSFAALAGAFPSAVAAAPVEIVASDETGITLRYESNDVPSLDDAASAPGYVDVRMRDAGRIGAEGAPELPVISVRVAVPDCERVDLVVTTGRSRVERGVRVTPSPTTVPVADGLPSEYRYVEGTVYQTPGLWPRRAAAVLGPWWIGTQRVATVEFYPCQIDAVDEMLVHHGVVEARLSFQGVRQRDAVRADRPRREGLLQAMILNYEDGKAWRARPSPGRDLPRGDYFTTSDNWAKVVVTERGMYRIGYADLEAAGIDAGVIDPSTIRVMSGGGLPVPWDVTDDRPEWMEECQIRVEGEDDGTFDSEDGVVFYGLGVDGWADEVGAGDLGEPFFENRFANENVYWMTWEMPGTPSGFSGEPLRMAETTPSATSPVTVRDYRARQHFELNVSEVQGRGDNWFWYEMKDKVSEDLYFHRQLNHVIADSAGILGVQVVGNSVDQVQPDHRAVFYLNGVEAFAGEWVAYSTFWGEGGGLPINEGYNTVNIHVPRDDPDFEEQRVLLDWFEIKYWRELWAEDEQLQFRSSGRTGELEYSLGGFADAAVTVYRIADKRTVDVIGGAAADGDRVVFRDDVADSASYIVVSPDGYLTPHVERDVFGNLREPTGDDYLMIVYDGFYDEAVRLKSHRESEAGGAFGVRLVKVSDVYDEFSWGLTDPAAIRDYLKYTYDRESLPPTHALLIGDTSSDYRQYLPSSVQSFMPAAYVGGASYWPSDSWFVGFSGPSLYLPALALGRLSARSASELRTMVDKIESYDTESDFGLWKNTAIFAADDEYKAGEPNPLAWYCCEYIHTRDAEEIATSILPAPIDRTKIYLMDYEHDAAGHKPEARSDIIDAWNDGALLFNYTGHGSYLLLAHEYVLLLDDVTRLKNARKLPLFFAASCGLNTFDMGTNDSLGETLVKSSVGGSIASMGSTRISGATANSELNGWFYHYMFGGQTEDTAPAMDIGTAFQAAFAAGIEIWTNTTKFCLLGDPAVTLAAASGGGSLSVDGQEPLMRRGEATLLGQNRASTAGRSGVAVVRVTESADTSGYLHHDPLHTPEDVFVSYTKEGRRVFDGPVSVSGGELSASFVVSAFAREGRNSRARVYYYDEDLDGAFSLEGLAIRDSVAMTDATAPEIAVEFEGGATSVLPGARVSVSLSDANGINLVDGAVGSGITARFGGVADTLDLTELFSYDLDSSERGTVEFELPSLESGGNSLSVSATDNMRNRATDGLAFEVISSTDFRIRDVANYPNPFPDGDTEGTHVLFQLPVSARVRIEVFTVGGRLIRVMDDIAGVPGANQVYWDGRDQEGDDLANGVYLYRVYAVSDAYSGDRAEVIGRAVVMR